MAVALPPAALGRMAPPGRGRRPPPRGGLNRLNVYPVPDGDTGTNMALTLEAVVRELDSSDGMAQICHAVSHGSLMGARGNSGVIPSPILPGLASSATHTSELQSQSNLVCPLLPC